MLGRSNVRLDFALVVVAELMLTIQSPAREYELPTASASAAALYVACPVAPEEAEASGSVSPLRNISTTAEVAADAEAQNMFFLY